MTLNALLAELAAQRGGSDLHLVVGQPPVFRVNGALIRRPEGPALTNPDMESLLFPHLTDSQRTLSESGRDVEKSLRIDEGRYKMLVCHERGNLCANVRVVPTRIPTLQELSLTTDSHAVLHRLIETSRRGLFIVSGPTGSGKSTTLCSLVDEINQQRAERIITIEDPIEYEFESKQSVISQRSVGEDVPTFADALRAAFHEDPDVLLVGAMRDLDTMMLALSLAENGHLVFSTLHAATASGAVQRLIDAWPENQQPVIRRMVATNLTAIVAQRLVPRANGAGRVAVQEIMLGSPRVRQLIAEGHNDLTVAIEAGRDLGMRTMDDDLVRLVEDGTITADVAWFHLQDKERLRKAGGNGVGV